MSKRKAIVKLTAEQQAVWSWLNKQGEATGYRDAFAWDAQQYSTLTAVYNIGFLVGGDAERQKTEVAKPNARRKAVGKARG